MTIVIIILSVINLVIVLALWMNQSARKNDQERLERLLRDEISKNREESVNNFDKFRESLTSPLQSFSEQFLKLTQINEQKLEKIRDSVDHNLKSLQEDNSQKLEKMRQTVDEKLHSTLEKRLGESFKIVSERLEKVHQGLGEMQNLAAGVGDLKKVLTNVKTRGTWGEVQLENLLDQVLTKEQYEKNVSTKKNSKDLVEFAIKFPGKDGHVVWLPIDSKFPIEDYERLLKAQEEANINAIEECSKAIENRLKLESRKIKEKYLDPPFTTDFGILFVPIEGLYAEILRRTGLCDRLQNEFRVIVTGPTTIWAILNSLQMGFRTLAVEKRASEVWNVLGQIKTEFGKFGELLDKTQKKLEEASNSIEEAATKSRTIERKLKNVQSLPGQAPATLESPSHVAQESIDNDSIV